MKKILVVLAAGALLAVSGCHEPMEKPAEPKAAMTKAAPAKSTAQMAYETELAYAKAALKRAATVDGVWRDSGKVLKKAAKAAEAGNFAEAKKLASKAKQQGMTGYEQAIGQINVGNPAYLYQ